ncbi:internal alternative NAD(P)H-ubiquinone oxidoreductase A1, mitochondrial-like [Carica papaya]|uniref:internal alternative NAD(P)H-ubiquinone oxidoreductase A1, mitochondrial-like n=1 Tax=Carica papaya TaxID=3649 RepID=UPI000B8C78F2|nr:internal alternative NAD(P)H-ubiquinone oxidoreductase A1, mitochondrial-like [Carica papaya]
MVWFKNLIQITTIKSSIKPRALNPCFPIFLSHFSTHQQINHDRQCQSPPTASTAAPSACYPGFEGLGPTKRGEKPRVVVLGSGWAACRLMKGVDTKTYDVVCISPRNHMVFTPLLASTCVGTLEFRSVAEPIARIQPAISREPGSYFFLANCAGIDTDKHLVKCETVTDESETTVPWNFRSHMTNW